MIKNEPPFPIGLKKPKLFVDPLKTRNRFGRMVYGHKTAGEICIMTKEQFEDFRSYEPGKMGISSIKTRSKSASGQAGTI